MAACSTLCCPCGKKLPAENKHNESLAIRNLWNFISAMLNGYAATQIDLQTKAPVVGKNKHVNGKYSRLRKNV
jgi:hypothetical protein